MVKPAADSRDLLVRGGAQLGLAMDVAGVERLLVYLAELMKWSRRVNLIARDTPEAQAVETHFLDSLTLLPFVDEAAAPASPAWRSPACALTPVVPCASRARSGSASSATLSAPWAL